MREATFGGKVNDEDEDEKMRTTSYLPLPSNCRGVHVYVLVLMCKSSCASTKPHRVVAQLMSCHVTIYIDIAGVFPIMPAMGVGV